MTISLYTELIQYEEVGGDMVERIRSLSVYEIFKPLIEGERFADREVFNKTLFWLLHCYSKESKKDILNSDWQNIKLTIAKEVGMPLDIASLGDPAVASTILNYLDYQDYRTYKHVKILKDAYGEMQNASLMPLKKGDTTNIDYEMKYKCGQYADDLLTRIDKYEQKLKDDNSSHSEAIKEVEHIGRRTVGTSLSVDSNEHIKT